MRVSKLGNMKRTQRRMNDKNGSIQDKSNTHSIIATCFMGVYATCAIRLLSIRDVLRRHKLPLRDNHGRLASV